MSAKGIWISVGLVALFAGGVAAGVLYCHHHTMSLHDHARHGTRDAAHGQYMEHFRKRLDLTDEQAAKVNDVLGRLHKEMQRAARDFHDNFKTLRSRAWTDVRATLSEKQRSEFETLVEEMEKKHAPQ